MCYYAIKASNGSKSIARTYVSTDDDEIESVCNQYDVVVHTRHPECGRDNSSFNIVIKDFLDKYDDIDIMVYIQATNPHTLAGDIENAIQKFVNGDYNLLMGDQQ